MMYQYRISNVRVIDGDTIECDIDLGFNHTVREHIRFKGVDTPELRDRDPQKREKAQEAKKYVVEWFNENPVAYIRSSKGDGFGRWLAYIYKDIYNLENELGEKLIQEGHAVEWKK